MDVGRQDAFRPGGLLHGGRKSEGVGETRAVDRLVPLGICRSSAVWAAVVISWKVMTTLPDRSRNADAVTRLAVRIVKGWPDRPCISVRPRADAPDGSSGACAALSKVRGLGAVANRTGGGGSRRSGFPIGEVSLSSALLIALPRERSGEPSYEGEELNIVPRRAALRLIGAWRRRNGMSSRPGRAGCGPRTDTDDPPGQHHGRQLAYLRTRARSRGVTGS